MIDIPRVRFALLPTPVEMMPRLSAALGGPTLWIKRDDQTGLAMGGNKTRKLEFLIAEAKAHGARTLLTAGAVQSNHCRQTAAAAARHGMDCILVLAGSPPKEISGNLLLDHMLGAKITWTSRSEREHALKKAFSEAWSAGKRPYLIPYGGSSPTGAAGYAYAVAEMMQQCGPQKEAPVPDWIVFASSSGGTQAGMAAGAKIFQYPGKILGISIDEKAEVLKARVADLAAQTADLLSAPTSFTPEDILVNDDYLGDGYGIMSSAEVEAITLFARLEGILLDPVYTGRSAAGLIDLIRRKAFPPGSNILFWHTGGSPALFAEQYRSAFV
jgi:D-cysteine desulfhydrase family pyridoxal phosphate-dependent enzyme